MNDEIKCPVCDGEGREICDNPDHGIIDVLVFHDIGRIGCPACGHDPEHKIKCETCNGAGKI